MLLVYTTGMYIPFKNLAISKRRSMKSIGYFAITFFANHKTRRIQPAKKQFPQDQSMIEDDVRIPSPFILDEFTKGENDEPSNPKNEYFKWIYKIPLNFYPTLHKQLYVLVIASLIVFLSICFCRCQPILISALLALS